MIDFINKNDYTLIELCKQTSSDTIDWSVGDTQGQFVKGVAWPRQRSGLDFYPFDECQTLCPVFQPYDDNDGLPQAKQAAIEEINRARDSLHHGGIAFNGHTFQTDEQSILDIMGACLAGEDTIWLTADNAEVSMTVADMQALGTAIAQRKEVLVYKARLFKDHIADNINSKEELDLYMTNLDWG